MGRLDGRVAIVTGASAGIRRATALAFAREGAAVTLADVTEDRGLALVDEIAGTGGRARFVTTDVADDAQVEAMVRAVGAWS